MNAEQGLALGTPALSLAGFQLWVHGYAYDLTDTDDAHWLRATAHCGASGASVWLSGVFLERADLAGFRQQLFDAHADLSTTVALEPLEPGLTLRIDEWDRSGACRLVVEITPDHLAQEHRFVFAIDQSYLATAVAELDALFGALAPRSASDRGV